MLIKRSTKPQKTEQTEVITMEANSSMKVLEENLGNTVTIEYVWFGKPLVNTGKLKEVRPYLEVALEQETEGELPLVSSISFVNTRRAVRTITRDDGVLLYENSLITPEHDVNEQEVYKIMVATFGEEAAEPWKPKPRVTAAT